MFVPSASVDHDAADLRSDLTGEVGIGSPPIPDLIHSGVNDIPVGTLRAVLLYHVAPGERFAEDVVSSSRIRTVSKGFLWPSVNGGGVYINDAQVIAADIDVSNGVIHVIDRVLLPA